MMADIGDTWVVTGKNVILHDGPFETSLSFSGTHSVTSQKAVFFKQQRFSLFVPSYATELPFEYS
jgi:hypothetical protein